MGDKATLAKARRELEELYLGVPDESVNLTFGDLAEVKQLSEKKKHTNMDPISETKPKEGLATLKKLPSLDFNRALQASKSSHDHHHHHHGHHAHVDSSVDSISHSHRHHGGEDLRASRGGHHSVNGENHRGHAITPNSHHHSAGFRHGMESSMAFDDVSGISMSSMHPIPERGGGRRRPGIPHSNICTICTTYIYIFRHRCLELCKHRHGRDVRRKKVCRVFGEKIQPKVHTKSRKDRVLCEVPEFGEAARTQVGRKRAQTERRERIW
ncbi:hypothetical protein L1049_014240 [Liquidambar formosana]|uniref:Uncharacterized protein n=1 Tax=Liquidambar formosana TaxID=63359 RepID=A0AAP0RNE7_LIQFO